MDHEEIIAMARESGFDWGEMGFCDRICFKRFADLAAAKEREAFAVLLLDKAGTTDYDYSTCINLVDDLRARGQKEVV